LPDGQIPSVEQAKEIFDFAKKIETIFKSLVEENLRFEMQADSQ
jgi:hypothetical protein